MQTVKQLGSRDQIDVAGHPNGYPWQFGVAARDRKACASYIPPFLPPFTRSTLRSGLLPGRRDFNPAKSG
jgi:hypothetical protein